MGVIKQKPKAPLLNRTPNPEVSDTTDDEKSDEAGKKITPNPEEKQKVAMQLSTKNIKN